ncbi:hypothetical protein JJQ60_10215 [Aquimarina mytili]|uniref:Uncharacterized protein n=2 Tax=Aquimarina mytili TaxID=874423 RepID=A0A937D9N6_9FLAO|nr:hypothetical protein [Aquimarina mytili]
MTKFSILQTEAPLKVYMGEELDNMGEELIGANAQNSLFRIVGGEGPIIFDF